MLTQYMIGSSSSKEAESFVATQMTLVRKVLFSRSLRLLPLSHQVGVVEGLAAIVKHFPNLLPLSDQPLITFLSELLKMASVADGEMTDAALSDIVVDRNGFISSPAEDSLDCQPTHSSSLFFRRTCAVQVDGATVLIPDELPAAVQLRVSAIVLLHGVIRGHTDPFFDADSSAPVGKSAFLLRCLSERP